MAWTKGRKSVLRGGYGRFYDKTHFELIGGIYTGTPFATSFVRNFPLQQADQGPRTGAFPTDPFLVNGPVITDAMRAELARMLSLRGRAAGTPAPPGTTPTGPCRTPISSRWATNANWVPISQ